jgi:FdhD protein
MHDREQQAPPDGAPDRSGSRMETSVREVRGEAVSQRMDRVAVEEPLEIRLAAGGERRTLAVTMRTPGEDRELAVGFLYGEGLIRDRALIAGVECFTEDLDPPEWAGEADLGLRRDVVEVELAVRRLPMLRSLERHFFTGSACGVCGRASLDELLVAGCEPAGPGPVFSAETVRTFPAALRKAQRVFEDTGGLHAAALFDEEGRRVVVREDVGRHNALDKLVGWAILEDRLNAEIKLDRHAVLVSGRASFELLQKCVAAGVPFLCAVSAPSSLAVEMARRFRVTLVGFLRGERFNVYSAPDRIEA